MSTSSHPANLDFVLLNADAYPGSDSHRRDATTTSDTTDNNQTVEVSFRPSRPPLPSKLFVHCPDLEDGRSSFTGPPRIIRAVEDLLLLRVPVPMGSQGPKGYGGCLLDGCNYFIYRANTWNPSLKLLPRPPRLLSDVDVGLLRRSPDHYTVAALVATPTPDVYDLHRLHSENGTWLHRKVSIGEPQKGFPLKIPRKSHRLLYHDTSTVVAIGGEHGTMGWVDLWRGVLLCDVLCDEPSLRGVPLPMPVDLLSCNNGRGVDLGCPEYLRGIAFIKRSDGTACLKLAHLEICTIDMPPDSDTDEETGLPSFIMRDWAVTTWSNTKMSSSWKDWHRDHRVQASNITIDTQLNSQLLSSGLLLCKPPQEQEGGSAYARRALPNLLVSSPNPGIDACHEDIVYLMARIKFLHPKVWVLALDMRNNKLLGAAEFATERQPGARAMYFPSTISKYINLGDCSRSPGE